MSTHAIYDAPLLPVRPFRRQRAASAEPAHGVSGADIKAIYRALVKQAVAGNLEAAREVLDRVERPAESDVLGRLETAEARLRLLESTGACCCSVGQATL